ncbi:hypothetical protein SALBM217S_05965 [Streptomyces griseoloalbus]
MGGEPLPDATAVRNSVTLDGAMPANQFSPRASRGASPTIGGGPRHPVGHQGRAGQRVRGASGAACHGEAVQAEGVGDAGDVLGDVRDPAAGAAVGAAVAGAVVADQPRAPLTRKRERGLGPTRLPYVQQEDGAPAGIPRDLDP